MSNKTSHIDKQGKLHINQNDSFEVRDRVYKQWERQQVQAKLKDPKVKNDLLRNFRTLGVKSIYEKSPTGIPTNKIDYGKSMKEATKNFKKTMGRGGGGGIPSTTGLIGKAVEKFFKKV
jgi:ABC-type oligopeptide transport system ATPase subunit